MHRDHLHAVGEHRLDGDLRRHLDHARQHVVAVEQRGRETHQVGDAAPLACAHADLVADVGNGLGLAERDATRKVAAREFRDREDAQTFQLGGGEQHGGFLGARG